jgi:hypothetical protein
LARLFFIGSDESENGSFTVAGWRKELRGGSAVVAISDEFVAKDSQVCDFK